MTEGAEYKGTDRGERFFTRLRSGFRMTGGITERE